MLLIQNILLHLF